MLYCKSFFSTTAIIHHDELHLHLQFQSKYVSYILIIFFNSDQLAMLTGKMKKKRKHREPADQHPEYAIDTKDKNKKQKVKSPKNAAGIHYSKTQSVFGKTKFDSKALIQI